MISRRKHTPLSGFTLVEVLVTWGLFTVVFLASIALIRRDRGLSGQILRIAQIETASQEMLFKLEGDLASAYGERPIAVAPFGLGAGGQTLKLDSSLGFPPFGTVVIDRGKDSEERIAYSALEGGKTDLKQLVRGVDCTDASPHAAQAEVMWVGVAEPLAQQVPPPDPEDYDGIALETAGKVYFRGDGSGFSYRVPVDPTETKSYIDGDDLKWGAEVPGVGPTLDGWQAIYFQPRTTFDEGLYGHDLNGDGDATDVFDVGQLRRVTWDTSQPNLPAFDVGIGPTAVVQERCNYGSDLDGDTYDDPLFLWDPWTNELHVRLYLLASSRENEPIIRHVESVMFLRNEPEL